MNLPNMITTVRFLISPIFLILLGEGSPRALYAALALYAVAGLTDLLDGYLARKMNQESSFGRMADPFVDKIIICGAFIMLIERVPMLAGWMVALIVSREFLVTCCRILVESRGEDFGSSFAGKQKMAIQFVTVAALILYTASAEDVGSVLTSCIEVLIWITVASTVISGVLYIRRAAAVFRRREEIT